MEILTACINSIGKLSLSTVSVQQTRAKCYKNIPHLRNPWWFLRKERKMRDAFVTPENKAFIQEFINDTYSPSSASTSVSLVKGVESNNTATAQQIVTNDNQEKDTAWKRIRRTGVIARKIGQYPLWLKNGEKIRTTLLQIIDNHVVKFIPPEEYKPLHQRQVKGLPNYGCLLVGAESCDPSTLTKEYCNLFSQTGLLPKRYLCRFIIPEAAAIPSGTPLNVGHFRVGEFVDVRGKTIDRGFQGVVKRHGFKGQPASHGVTKTHRRPGNIGGGGEKGRVWPGTKLPGHMGNRWRVCRGLRIWRINNKYNVMWVQGSAIPGPTNGIVYIYDTILPLRKPETPLPFPTSFAELDGPDDIWCEDVHDFKTSTITFAPEAATS